MRRRIKLRHIIITFVIIIILPLFRTTCKDYFYSEDGKHCLTIIQRSNILYPEEAGVYFINGKFKGRLPKDNYVFTKLGDTDFLYCWSGDTLYLKLPYWEIVENKLNPADVVLSGITDDDGIKYGWGTMPYRDFIDSMSNDYYRINPDDLTWW